MPPHIQAGHLLRPHLLAFVENLPVDARPPYIRCHCPRNARQRPVSTASVLSACPTPGASPTLRDLVLSPQYGVVYDILPVYAVGPWHRSQARRAANGARYWVESPVRAIWIKPTRSPPISVQQNSQFSQPRGTGRKPLPGDRCRSTPPGPTGVPAGPRYGPSRNGSARLSGLLGNRSGCRH